MKEFFRIFKHKGKSLQGIDLQTAINLQHNFYMPMDLNAAHYNKKVVAIDNIHRILSSCDRVELQESDFEELLLGSLTLVYYFGMRLKLSRLTSRYWYWCGKRQFRKAEIAFKKTMDMLLPECSEITIKITLKFFTDVSLWPFESFVAQILEVILFFIRGKTTLFNLMLTDIHCVLFNNVKSARHRMRVFYDLLNSSNWVIDKQKLLPFVTRLLDFFAQSIAKDENRIPAYNYLRKGFEVSLRRIFERVTNQHRLMIIITMLNWFWIVSMNRESVLEFAMLLYHAVDYYQVGLYKESLKGELIEHVLKRLASSPTITYGLVGCRLLLRFLDRGKNSNYLNAPILFYEFSQAPIVVGVCEKTDKAFIREHREMIQECLIKGVQFHSTNISYVKHVYSIICAIVLEVPCGLTAAASACMLMEIQEKALNAEKIPPSSRYWMHALVVSVMSLICWVHKAPVLYTYVNQIISRRAQEAPQLNPPIMNYYKVSRHHVTWNKPTLFFEDWELRYALWKHFQINETKPSRASKHLKKDNKKVPSLDLRS